MTHENFDSVKSTIDRWEMITFCKDCALNILMTNLYMDVLLIKSFNGCDSVRMDCSLDYHGCIDSEIDGKVSSGCKN